MGRPSKLTPKQEEAIRTRLLAGEKAADLCREFKISKAAFSERFSERNRTIKKVANQIVETERAISELKIPERNAAFGLAERIRQMNENITTAGDDLAIVSKMFAKASKDGTSQIMFKAMGDDGETINSERLAECTEEIAAVMKSAMVANESGKIALKLMDISSKTQKEPEEQNEIVVTGGMIGDPVAYEYPKPSRSNDGLE